MAKVAVVLTERFADWEYAYIAGAGGYYYGLTIRFFSPTAGPVTSLGGLPVSSTGSLADLTEWAPSVVAVIGGTIWDGPNPPDLSDMLQAEHARGATVGGICGGTLALARAGLLEDVAHTSNTLAFVQEFAPTYTGEVHYVDTPDAVADSRVISAAGSSPATFAAAVFDAAGVAPDTIAQFKDKFRAEHTV